MSATHIRFGGIEAAIMGATKQYFYLFLLVFLSKNIEIQAHPMPNSILFLTVLEDKVEGRAQIPMRDLQSVLGEEVSLDDLKKYFLAHIKPIDLEGNQWKVEINNAKIINTNDSISGNYAELEIEFYILPKNMKSPYHFIFDYDVVCHQVVTHKVFVLVKYREKQISETIELDIPTEKIKPLIINLEEENTSKKFSKMLYACGFLIFSILIISLILKSKKFKLIND